MGDVTDGNEVEVISDSENDEVETNRNSQPLLEGAASVVFFVPRKEIVQM